MHILEIMKTHPGTASHASTPLIQCIEACFDCAQTTIACADACLAEADPAPLARCIRINGECSDIVMTTGRLLSRRLPSDTSIWDRQLEAAAVVARMCAEECERHAAHHDHCRVCASACRKCERACNALLESYRPTADTVA
jgi:hypothetical protein